MKNALWTGLGLVLAFLLWTVLVRNVDVQPIGPMGSQVGFAAWNGWFHNLTGEHMALYVATDWLELLAIGICCAFGAMGVAQLVRRKSLRKVDADLLLLGGYYVVVIAAFLFFELFPINYRPVLIEGVLEASYPSSTTLLVLSVMPTLGFQVGRRCKAPLLRKGTWIFVGIYCFLIVLGRLISGVHWLTDILGAILLSAGLFQLYRYAVRWAEERHGVS
ncbi:MAG: phosphatase PAP2 family protein [bacterium]